MSEAGLAFYKFLDQRRKIRPLASNSLQGYVPHVWVLIDIFLNCADYFKDFRGIKDTKYIDNFWNGMVA